MYRFDYSKIVFRAIDYLVENNIIKVQPESNNPFENIESVTFEGEPIFNLGGQEGVNYFIKDGKKVWLNSIISLKPELTELYDEIGIFKELQKTIVVFPIFTSSAYQESGFYSYYRGECDTSCLTTEIKFDNRPESSGNAAQVLELLGYPIIPDDQIDKNPNGLDFFDKVILLHSEYVTKKEYDAITQHPKVIYLYPNSLYAEIKADYSANTITLIRGHNYPDPEIKNGFDWKFDNTHLEYDRECKDWKFYKVDNGIMLNCYPEGMILKDAELLKAIKDY